ncbi:hypothetical protein GCM10009751_10070 [Myceligenerans crystallogenes]|uniref:HTH tetR-type domain-containing protein n=1 Tax=Myceligenerans crystallogenes TaxID=316335 RepID=A0ABN2N9Q3_9MICO
MLLVAARLFGEHGFEGTSIRQIATDAGVSVGTVMAIGDKKHLLVEVFSDWIAEIHQKAAELPPVAPPDDLTDALCAVVGPFLDMFLDNGELARHYGAALIHAGDRTRTLNLLGDRLCAEARAAMLRFSTDAEQADAVADLLYHLYLGHLFAWAIGRFGDDELHRRMRGSIEFVVTVHRPETTVR